MKIIENEAPVAAADSGDKSQLGKKSRRALSAAVMVGLVGMALHLFYLRRFEEEVSGGGRVPLLTVVKPIPRGSLITADMLTVSTVPQAYVEQRAVRLADRDKVLGVRAANTLTAQDTLLWSDLALASEDRDLSTLVQPGKRAVTVRASEAGSDPAGNGLLRPGDYVDVIVTLRGEMGSSASSAVVLLQRVLVLAIGSQTEASGFAEGQARNERSERELTLSLKVEEAQLLSLARERGTLSVALRAPNDSKVIENIADLPLSSLYDKAVRETVQRRSPVANVGPTRVQSEPR